MMARADALLTSARAAEEAMLTPELRRDPKRVRELLHPDFVEVGRSGRRWSRDDIATALADEHPLPVVTDEWETVELAPDLALVTYTITGPGQPSRHSSLWMQSDGRVRLRFHQGTFVTQE